jgi:hypothetical protein
MSMGCWRLSCNVVGKVRAIPDYNIVAVNRLPVEEAIKFCFKKLRDIRKEEMKHRERRHYWWGCRKDEQHCCYFPRDYPTDEEVEWYKHVLELQKRGEFKGYVYDSTQDAIIEWLTDDAYLQMDKIAFPNHRHGASDFYHDQLFGQEYYKEDMKPENKDRFRQGSPTAYPYRDNMREMEQTLMMMV